MALSGSDASMIASDLARSLATSQVSPAATLAIAIWADVWPPWIVTLVVVHFAVIVAMRVIGPIADAVGSTRAALIRRRGDEGDPPS